MDVTDESTLRYCLIMYRMQTIRHHCVLIHTLPAKWFLLLMIVAAMRTSDTGSQTAVLGLGNMLPPAKEKGEVIRIL